MLEMLKMNNEYKLTKFVQAAGWAAKMGPGDLKQTICGLTPKDERILVGFDTSEDASVYQINENQANSSNTWFYNSCCRWPIYLWANSCCKCT